MIKVSRLARVAERRDEQETRAIRIACHEDVRACGRLVPGNGDAGDGSEPVPGDHVGPGFQVIQAFLVGQPAAECPELRPLPAVAGEVGAHRFDGRLGQCPQPARWCQPGAGARRAEPLVELIPGEPAGKGLDVEQAGRPLRGTHPAEDPLMRLRPPRPGPAAGAEGTGPPGLLAQMIGGIAFSQLLHPALRVTAQPLALPALRGLARLALLGSHGRQRSVPAQHQAVPPAGISPSLRRPLPSPP